MRVTQVPITRFVIGGIPASPDPHGGYAAQRYFTGASVLEFHVFEPHTFHAGGDVVLVELRVDLSHRETGRRAQLDD